MAISYSMVGILSKFLLSSLLVVCLYKFGKCPITLLSPQYPVFYYCATIKPLSTKGFLVLFDCGSGQCCLIVFRSLLKWYHAGIKQNHYWAFLVPALKIRQTLNTLMPIQQQLQ
jgi:hypothetical protein